MKPSIMAEENSLKMETFMSTQLKDFGKNLENGSELLMELTSTI